MADRYAYVPLLGIFVACVWLVADLKNRFKVPMSAVALVIFLLLGLLAADTRHQLAYWRDSVSLFSRALEVGGSSYTVESNFASALDEAGRPSEAASHFRAALALAPYDANAHYNFGVFLDRRGNQREAVVEYARAEQLAPDSAVRTRALINLALTAESLGDFSRAATAYQQLLRIAPHSAAARAGIDRALIKLHSQKSR